MSKTALSIIIAIALIVGGAIALRVMRDLRAELDARAQIKPIMKALGREETQEEEAHWADADKKVYWAWTAIFWGVILLLYVGCEAIKSPY
jgi:hypothetical protein